MDISYSLINPVLQASQILLSSSPSPPSFPHLNFFSENIVCVSYSLMHLTCLGLIHLVVATVLGEDEVTCELVKHSIF
jgi:hypothetical protein